MIGLSEILHCILYVFLVIFEYKSVYILIYRKKEPLHNERLAKVVVSKMGAFLTHDMVSTI